MKSVRMASKRLRTSAMEVLADDLKQQEYVRAARLMRPEC